MEFLKIPLDKIVPNSWNPNAMDDETFNRLTEEMQEVGYIDPIQVIPIDDGTFRILGGEHRYHVAKVLGWEEMQCVVLSEEKWQDEDLQKFVTVRLNILRGKTNPTKMIQLYEEMAQKYGDDALQGMFAYTDQEAWTGLLKSIGKGLKGVGLPGDLGKQFDAAKDEIKTVEDLSNVLNTLFTKYGNTLDRNFMVFTFGGKDHVYVAMDAKTHKEVKKITSYCTESEKDINEVLLPALVEAAGKIGGI